MLNNLVFDTQHGHHIITGKGSSCVVKQGHFQGIPCAVKVVKTAAHKSIIQNERVAFTKLKTPGHDNIVCLLHFLHDDTFSYFVLEMHTTCTLHAIAGQPVARESITWKETILRQVGAALQYMHSHGMVHGDVKEDNILVNSKFAAKLCDFGLSRILPLKKQWTTLPKMQGTIGYIPPEMYESCVLGYCTDVWAIGIIAHRLYLKYNPFRNYRLCVTTEYQWPTHTTLSNIPHLTPDIQSWLKHLLTNCLRKNFTQRGTLDSLNRLKINTRV